MKNQGSGQIHKKPEIENQAQVTTVTGFLRVDTTCYELLVEIFRFPSGLQNEQDSGRT